MKLQGITLFALFLAKASAAGSGLFAANGFEVEVFVSNGETFIGEPQSLVEENALEGRATSACTRCVGHHGSCVVGEGNCYAPDSCLFCGACSYREARCQNPKTAGCQCYL